MKRFEPFENRKVWPLQRLSLTARAQFHFQLADSSVSFVKHLDNCRNGGSLVIVEFCKFLVPSQDQGALKSDISAW